MSEAGLRKLPQIEGQDQWALPSNCGGQGVTILGIIGEVLHERLITSDDGFRERPPNLRLVMIRQVFRPAQISYVRAPHFGQHFLRPNGQKEPRTFREAKENVADRVVRQHAGIDENFEIGPH